MQNLSHLVLADTPYDLGAHLAEIEDLYGAFPKTLPEKGDQQVVKGLFDGKDKVKRLSGFDYSRDPMSDFFTRGLDREEKEECVKFLRLAMSIDPAKRPTPEALLRGPWLRAIK
ncbi:hypothetical protein PG990_010636 [Apiospora arundinis]